MEKTKERGVTLVETIVAMSLVVIISLAIYTTLNYSVTAHSKEKCNNFFAGEIENVAMCYYNSNDNYENINATKFEQLFKFTYGIEPDDSYIEFDINSDVEPNIVRSLTIFYSSDYKMLKVSEKENASYKIVFSFNDQTKITAKHIIDDSAFLQREV